VIAAGGSIKSALIVVNVAVAPDWVKTLHVSTQFHVLVTTLQPRRHTAVTLMSIVADASH